MHLKVLASSLVLAVAAVTAQAADLPNTKAPAAAPVAVSPWDFQVTGGLTSNYIFRGITQSNNGPSVSAGGELRYNINDMFQTYIGVSGESIKLATLAPSPTMELDTYGGVRGTFGNLTTDIGIWGYWYPGASTPNLIYPTNPSFYEVYGKLGYNITDWLNVGANIYYTPSYLDTRANGTYFSGTAKATWGDFSVSGELGRQDFGTTDLLHAPYFGSRRLPDYTYYNVGASYQYKFVTLDLRYYGNSLNKFQCQQITGPTVNFNNPNSSYCGGTVVGTISFAFTSKDIK